MSLQRAVLSNVWFFKRCGDINKMIKNQGKVSKWDYRFFHLHADGRSIREVDVMEIRERLKTMDNRVIIAIRKNNITIYNQGKLIHFNRRQLQEVLSVNQVKEKKTA